MKKITFILTLIIKSVLIQCQISNLEACYALSGNANDPINNLNGSAGGGILSTTDRNNFPFGCFSFNGTPTATISLPNDPRLKGQAMSVSAWVYPTVVNGSYVVFTKNNFNSYHEAYALSISGNKFAANKVNTGGHNYQFSNTTVQTNTWYHLVMCVDQNNLYLYVNGVLESSGSAPGMIEYQTGKNVYIGGSGETYFPGAFNGKIDNVKFFSKVLNAAEVNQLYTVDAPCVCTGPIFASLKYNNANYPIIPPSVGNYNKFEIDLDIRDCNWNKYLEPSDPNQIDTWAVFHSPSGKTFTVHGFFYQDYARSYGNAVVAAATYGYPSNNSWAWNSWYKQYCGIHPATGLTGFAWPYEILDQSTQPPPNWKIRFTPNEIGNWTFEVFARQGGTGGQCTSWGGSSCASFFPLSFNCTSSSNKGFIRKANKRYLKYDNGESFFPIGTGMGQYTSVSFGAGGGWCSPEVTGTVEYEVFLKQLADVDEINYIRIFLQSGGINIFGYDYNMDVCYYKNVVWNDPTNNNNPTNTYGINLRDAWELDWIFEYCKQKGINIQLAFFNSADFVNIPNNPYGPNPWKNNPFNSSGQNEPQSTTPTHNHLTGASGCGSPYEFFDINKPAVLKLQHDMISYVINRWGYAPNLVSWEIMNEINLVFNQNIKYGNPWPSSNFEQSMFDWVAAMKTWISYIDPYKHLVTCTPVNNNLATIMVQDNASGLIDMPNSTLWTQNPKRRLANEIWKIMDYTDEHRYTDPFISVGNPASQQIYSFATDFANYGKPHFISEFTSLCPNGNEQGCSMYMKTDDPHGFHFHGVSWSSGFNGNLGVGNCWWHDNIVLLDGHDYNLKALHEYWQDVPLDQDDNMTYGYTPRSPIFGPWPPTAMNHFMTRNRKEVYGYMQHPNFSIEYLKIFAPTYLSNLTNRPITPGGMSMTFSNMENGTYTVKWYNTKTGTLISSQSDYAFNNILGVAVPNSIFSDVNNTFGDVAYKIKKDCHTQECGWNENPLNLKAPVANVSSKVATSLNHVFFVDNSGNLCNLYMDGTWQGGGPINFSFTKVAPLGRIETDANGNVYYIGVDNQVYKAYWNNGWYETVISGGVQAVQKGGITVDAAGVVYFTSNLGFNPYAPARIFQAYQSGPNWVCSMLPGSPLVKTGSDLAVNETLGKYDIFYVGLDMRVHSFRKSGVTWSDMLVSNNQVHFSSFTPAFAQSSKLFSDKNSKRVFYIANNNLVYNAYSTTSPYVSWVDSWLNGSGAPCFGTEIYADGGHVFYAGPGNNLYNYYWDPNIPAWLNGPLNQCRVGQYGGNTGLSLFDNHLYYIGTNGIVRGAFWTYDVCPLSRGGALLDENTNENVATTKSGNRFNLVIEPNPATSETNIHIETNWILNESSIIIMNIMGEVVQTNKVGQINIGASDFKLSLRDLKPGIYFVSIIDGDTRLAAKKLIID